jgi:hypothetical protein
VEELHGLVLELRIVRRSFRFDRDGHGGFSFSSSPPRVHRFGGSSHTRLNIRQRICSLRWNGIEDPRREYLLRPIVRHAVLDQHGRV